MAKVTSKGQITIPGEVRRALGLEPGDQVSFEVDDEGVARVRKLSSLTELRGSVSVPDELRGKRWEEIRTVASRERGRARRGAR